MQFCNVSTVFEDVLHVKVSPEITKFPKSKKTRFIIILCNAIFRFFEFET